MNKKPSAVVIGVGAEEGLGAALCRKFASEGYHLYVAGRTSQKINQVADSIRNAGDSAEAIVTDTTDEKSVSQLFERAFTPSTFHEPPDLIVFNAGNNRKIDLLELTASQFEDFWRVGCFGGFLVGKEAVRNLLPLGRGTVLFTGASGSLRGKSGYAHFAAAKAGLRMITQSMAREYGPQGLHIAHVIIDGGIKGERLKRHFPDRVKERGEAGLLGLEGIAETYWFIHKQQPTTWTQEIDLRPSGEPF
ncbi:SDR family NAD(P)-dependent oxidoreductase [Pantoea sp. NPDC088449]|uniref:SDR family NAD(P)-dependent oxidoreductase n=1 Tax=Pantoea sp. NPDC088449 TaxID=3364392 RepID=UPI0037F6E4AD